MKLHSLIFALHSRRLLHVQRAAMLTSSVFCEMQIASRGRDSIASVASRRFAPRTQIFRESEPARHVYEVVDGLVMLYKLLPDGRRQIVELISAGGVFGVSSVPVYDCFAETLAASQVIAHDRASIEQSPELCRHISECVKRQYCSSRAHALVLGRKTATERIATFMMQCIPGRGGYNCPGPRGRNDSARIRLGLTRQEIADYLCLTIETVSRTLTALRRRGLIKIDKREQLRVNDVCRVCRMTGDH